MSCFIRLLVIPLESALLLLESGWAGGYVLRQDTNGDGFMDRFEYYERVAVLRVERDTNHD
nr:hypothetical protein [Desulfobacterales bacterium]